MRCVEINFNRRLFGVIAAAVAVLARRILAPKFFAALLLLVTIAPPLFAAPAEPTEITEYQVKAAFLFKFCLYIEWPANAFTTADSPIVLGVAGPDSLVELLKAVVKDHKINARALKVRHIDSGEVLDGVHLLFVARSEQTHLPQFVAQAQGRPLLLVTETPADLDDGGSINFAIQDNRIRFDADLDTAARQRVRLSAQLLKVARAVRGETGS